MSRSLRVAPNHIEKVKFAVKRKGYPSQRALALEVGLSRATVASFLNGRSVDFLNFTEICEKLGLDWQEIVHIDYEDESEIEPPALSTTSQEKPQSGSNRRVVIKLSASFDELDEQQLQSIVELLRQMPGNASMTIETIEQV